MFLRQFNLVEGGQGMVVSELSRVPAEILIVNSPPLAALAI